MKHETLHHTNPSLNNLAFKLLTVTQRLQAQLRKKTMKILLTTFFLLFIAVKTCEGHKPRSHSLLAYALWYSMIMLLYKCNLGMKWKYSIKLSFVCKILTSKTLVLFKYDFIQKYCLYPVANYFLQINKLKTKMYFVNLLNV